MPSPTRRQRAEGELVDMVADLTKYYRECLRQCEPTGNPAHIKYVVDAGVRLIGFLSDQCPAQDGQDKVTPKLTIQPGKAVAAFGALLQRQALEQRQDKPANVLSAPSDDDNIETDDSI